MEYDNNQTAFLEKLGIAANVFQVASYMMNLEQISNDELMKALEFQNTEFLIKITENQKLILEKLTEICEKLDKI